MLSSLKVEDEDGRMSVSSLKLRTRSSMRPNCLLIRRVRGVIFRGRGFLGLFDTNRSAYCGDFFRTKDNETEGVLSAHAACPIVILIYTHCIYI